MWPAFITPARFGPQIIQERDGYDRVTKPGNSIPRENQGAASFTVMHNHTGTHLDTFSHVYRENSLYNNAPPPRPDGTVHGDAASVKSIVGRGVTARCCEVQGTGSTPKRLLDQSGRPPEHGESAKGGDPKGDVLLIRTGWRKMWDEPGTDGRVGSGA